MQGDADAGVVELLGEDVQFVAGGEGFDEGHGIAFGAAEATPEVTVEDGDAQAARHPRLSS